MKHLLVVVLSFWRNLSFYLLIISILVITTTNAGCGDTLIGDSEVTYPCGSPGLITTFPNRTSELKKNKYTDITVDNPALSAFHIQGEIKITSTCSATSPYTLLMFT